MEGYYCKAIILYIKWYHKNAQLIQGKTKKNRRTNRINRNYYKVIDLHSNLSIITLHGNDLSNKIES